MELFTAENELSIRLYKWAVLEYEREREHGYPMLRAIGNRGAYIFLHLVWPLVREQEALLGTALLKHAHPKALRHLGEVPTEEERALRDKYFALYRHEALHAQRPVMGLKRAELAVERRKLVREAICALKPILGKPSERDVYDTYYNIRIDDWELTSIIGSGRASFDCTWILGRSDHSMSRFTVDNPDPMGHNHNFDYTSLLGMFTRTSWENVTGDDLAPVLEGLATVSSHLMQEIPPLLKGLSISDMSRRGSMT